MPKKDRLNRRQQILEALVQMLEDAPGARITTANLAREVGVTEAALYRHFPSKGKMFDGLIEFIEETLFSRINLIIKEPLPTAEKLERILTLVLTFAEKNPGMCRILMGDALAGETERLRQRVAQVFERLETQLRQVIRDAEHEEKLRPAIVSGTAANLLLSMVEGRIHQYVRTEFSDTPTSNWKDQWLYVSDGLLV